MEFFHIIINLIFEKIFEFLKLFETLNNFIQKAAPRFELGNRGFAIHGLTTWLYRHYIELVNFFFSTPIKSFLIKIKEKQKF